MTADDHRCQECGEQLGPGATFCRNCGTRYKESEPGPPAEPDPVPTCPECGAELAPAAAFCRSCGTSVGGTETPTEVEQTPIVPTPTPPSLASEPPPPAPSPRPSDGGHSLRRIALMVSALVLIVGTGVTVALLVTQNSGSNSVTTTVDLGTLPRSSEREEAAAEVAEPEEETVEVTEPAEDENEEAESEGAEEPDTSGYPEVPRKEMNEEVTSVLEHYHEDVVDEDLQGAWATLSRRKRQQDTREYGYHRWASAQASLSPYFDPYGLEAEIVALEGEGVARVEVTGMAWNAPGASCSEWSGLTWVKYEDGGWAYDPGYSTTAARRSDWRSKSDRLLGGDC